MNGTITISMVMIYDVVLSVVILNAVVLSVIILNVVAPHIKPHLKRMIKITMFVLDILGRMLSFL